MSNRYVYVMVVVSGDVGERGSEAIQFYSTIIVVDDAVRAIYNPPDVPFPFSDTEIVLMAGERWSAGNPAIELFGNDVVNDYAVEV